MWPTTIVNMQHPAVMEHFIRRYGREKENRGAIVHGVGASIAMACDMVPNHPLVKKYIDWIPQSPDPICHTLWNDLVRGPAEAAVRRYQPILRKHGMLEEVFRFQDLDTLVDSLDPYRRGPVEDARAVCPEGLQALEEVTTGPSIRRPLRPASQVTAGVRGWSFGGSGDRPPLAQARPSLEMRVQRFHPGCEHLVKAVKRCERGFEERSPDYDSARPSCEPDGQTGAPGELRARARTT